MPWDFVSFLLCPATTLPSEGQRTSLNHPFILLPPNGHQEYPKALLRTSHPIHLHHPPYNPQPRLLPCNPNPHTNPKRLLPQQYQLHRHLSTANTTSLPPRTLRTIILDLPARPIHRAEANKHPHEPLPLPNPLNHILHHTVPHLESILLTKCLGIM